METAKLGSFGVIVLTCHAQKTTGEAKEYSLKMI
jgi:hypothetical protein